MVAVARVHPKTPQTWETTYNFAVFAQEEKVHYTDLPPAGKDAMKKSYQRVSKRIKQQGLYYRGVDGLKKRVDQAWNEFLSILKPRRPSGESGAI